MVSVEGAKFAPIVVGDAVMRDEVVQTKTNSDARIELLDKTKLTLGPNSILKIDRAVYADASKYKQITIRLTEGAFRFITGNSGKKSYRIETPFAVIGVRGTILDIQITEDRSLVTLQDGQASVCAGSKCTQLLERGNTANVSRNGNVIEIKRELVPTWTFASVCSANSALCAPLPALSNLTKRANLATPTNPGKALKGSAITRFCSDGRPMIGNRCDPIPTRDTSLPRLTDGAREQPSFSPPGGLGPAPLGAPPVGFPSASSPSLGGPGGIAIPRLGR